ncbi:MAG: GNAT family N-acetyltransferase [Pseudomonadota bacterium]
MIETGRLILRRFRQTDLPQVETLLRNADVMRFSEAGPLSHDACQRWLQGAVDTTGSPPPLGVFALEVKPHQAPVGYVSLRKDPPYLERNEAEFGIRVLPHIWGKGMAFEAARAVIAMTANAALTRIVAHVDPQNMRSIRLIELLGFARCGEVMLPGYDHPDLVFSRTAEQKGG